MNRTFILIWIGVLFSALTLGCGGRAGSVASNTTPTTSSNPPAASPPPAPPPSSSPPGGIPRFSHVVLVVEENTSFEQVIGNTAMPFFNQLASKNALATQYYALVHPSIGNYFMLTTGQVITIDDNFSGTVTADNLARVLAAEGKTWKVYAQGLPSVGYTGGDTGAYLRHHNPFSYFSDVVNTSQSANLVPFSQFGNDLTAGRLPDFSLIVPDARHDAHDCPDGGTSCSDATRLGTADAWLQQNVSPLLDNNDFQQSGLLIVVFDESVFTDFRQGGGHVAMLAAGAKVKKGFQSSQQHDHLGTLRLILQALGVTRFPGAAAAASDMSEFF